jgi:hypothetical protein
MWYSPHVLECSRTLFCFLKIYLFTPTKGKEMEGNANKPFNIHNIVEYYLLVGPQTCGYYRVI